MRILLLLFIFITTNAYAENWICYDETTKEITNVAQGDCYKMGLCSGFNNTGLQTNCFEATQEEYDKARTRFIKFDSNVVSGIRVVDITRAEKDAINATKLTNKTTAVRTDAKNAFTISGVSIGDSSPVVFKALINILLDEINILRSKAGLQPRTLQQLKNALELRIDAGEFD